MSARITFKRVVVGLHQSVPDPAALRMAAEVAGLLHIDLCGLYIEDPGVLGIAGRTGAREFEVLARRWRDVEPERLSREIEASARAARRLFDDTAGALGVPTRFEVMRAAVGEAITSASRPSDIVIVAEPGSPAERAVAPYPQLLKAALACSATVLFLPRRLAHARGPILVIALSPDDASIEAGAAIAGSAREPLVVIEAYEAPSEGGATAAPETVPAGEVTVSRLHMARRALADVRALAGALSGLGERMIVVTRTAFGGSDGPAELASLTGTPVLVLEPTGDRIAAGGEAADT